MVSGFDIWGHDTGLRRHWKNRALAFIVDAIISFVPASIILFFLDITDILQFGIIISTMFYLVASIPESLTGSTLGKRFFHLRVHGVDGGAIAGRVFIRNLSRLFWFVLPPLDFALGMAIRGDPRQRMLDRVAGTKVVHREEKEKHDHYLEALNITKEAPELDIEEVVEKKPGEDLCHDCKGKLILLADDKLQCEKCGLIQ